jgi:transposase
MRERKVTPSAINGKRTLVQSTHGIPDFDHYVSVDWSMKTMAIGHLRHRDKNPNVFERPADIHELRDYLKSLHGSIVLTVEETTSSHWLYLELRDCVDRIIVCDPFKNRLLNDGPKTDKIDAAKLVILLRGRLLTEVFHRDNELYDLRLLVSAYTDLIQAGVRLQNQRSALERGHGDASPHAPFILEHLDNSIALYRQSRNAYKKKFEEFCRRNNNLRSLKDVEGIDIIGAVKILAIVVDARRFPRTAKYHNYCGLVSNGKFSGGRFYGRRKAHYCRALKAVYKTAALNALRGNNPVREYYEWLLAKGLAEVDARNAIARHIATITYGILKTGTPYDPYRWRTTAKVA